VAVACPALTSKIATPTKERREARKEALYGRNEKGHFGRNE
jgi:hypothetical protein